MPHQQACSCVLTRSTSVVHRCHDKHTALGKQQAPPCGMPHCCGSCKGSSALPAQQWEASTASAAARALHASMQLFQTQIKCSADGGLTIANAAGRA